MFGTRGASTLKSIILDHLRRLGATRMEASYDGGNDEGGVNDVRVLRPVTEENPAWVIYALRQNYKGELVRDYGPMAGPFYSEKDAQAAGLAMEETVEIVQVESEFVPLIGADVGTWEDEDGLYRAVDELLSIDFGSWAGDFSASGMVYADLASGRVWREGEISSYASDESAGEY